MTSMTKRGAEDGVLVVGGGASGMMAALTAARAGASVTLFERNERLGKKLRITGKGRCNVTNNCDRATLLSNIPTNGRFLYGAFSRFSPADTMEFFEGEGVPLKTERGNRVFPVSDRAGDIVAALERACRASGVAVVKRRVDGLLSEGERVVGVRCGEERFLGRAVILCTGGRSYPTTGSDGDGYRFAASLGHTVTPIAPSLVPLVAEGKLCASLQGLSLKNVRLSVRETASGRTIFEDFGEMMFTHFGLTGPMVLSASAHLAAPAPGKYEVLIDLKPALDERTLDARIRADFVKYQNRDFCNALDDLLPQKLIAPMVGLCGIDPHKKVHSITQEERRTLLQLLKGLRIPIRGFRSIDEAIITRGGISVKEVDPGTMASKKLGGLYFAGELLDVDAYTGGFNLQIAFSTAVAAGTAAAEAAISEEEIYDSDCH